MDTQQREVFDFLASPSSWPTQPDRIQTIETHGARVFLAGNEVLKIKRAVHLPYLDFTTLKARRHYCEREIALNKGGANSIYRDVVAITREASGALAIAGDGTPVEWAVRMWRFPQDDLLKNAVHRGPLSRALAEDLADAVFRYHAAATRAPASAENIADVAQGVLSSLEQAANPVLRPLLAKLDTSFREHLQNTNGLRSERARAGFVRRCHGDLHTGNIVIWRGKPVLFDALEFDEKLATTDTLYDLAFLLMDLDRQGSLAAANTVMNRYLWRTRDALDIKGLQSLPLFLGLRAAIRTLVALNRAATVPEHSAEIFAQAERTLLLALRDLSPIQPRLIAVGGLSGTGKTTLARAIAPHVGSCPGALHLRTDMERKSLAGVEPEVRLAASSYTKAASAAVYEHIFERARLALQAGHAVVLDAVFADPAERSAAEGVAMSAGVAFTGLWLTADRTTLTARVETRIGDASDATADVVAQQLTYDTGAIEWHVIPASGEGQAVAAHARKIIALRD